jgi:hypothetical protein
LGGGCTGVHILHQAVPGVGHAKQEVIPPLTEDFNLHSSANVCNFAVLKGQFVIAGRESDNSTKPGVIRVLLFIKLQIINKPVVFNIKSKKFYIIDYCCCCNKAIRYGQFMA